MVGLTVDQRRIGFIPEKGDFVDAFMQFDTARELDDGLFQNSTSMERRLAMVKSGVLLLIGKCSNVVPQHCLIGAIVISHDHSEIFLDVTMSPCSRFPDSPTCTTENRDSYSSTSIIRLTWKDNVCHGSRPETPKTNCNHLSPT